MTAKVDLRGVPASALLDEICDRLQEFDPLYRLDRGDVVDALWPIGGPYGNDESSSATAAIAALVRYLNHATYNHASVPFLSTADAMFGGLASAAHGGVQLLHQLTRRLAADQHIRSVYDDSDSKDEDLAATTLAALRAKVAAAAVAQAVLAEAFDAIKRSSPRLGNLTDEDNHLIDREGNRV